jgi:hypothetical protein
MLGCVQGQGFVVQQVFIGVVVEKKNNVFKFALIFHFLSQSKTMT